MGVCMSIISEGSSEQMDSVSVFKQDWQEN